jgi:hypothetical protein
MFLAPTASSLRRNRAEREVSGWLVTRAVPMAGLSKTRVNTEVFAELDLVAEGAFGLVTNYGRRSLTDYVKVGTRTGISAFAGSGGQFRLVVLTPA